MIVENSGKIYRFKLDHDLGFGFAEIYDFTDEQWFDGQIVYVHNCYDKLDKKNYELAKIRTPGIALGPIRLGSSPNTRALHSWRYLFQTDALLVKELPEYKTLQGLEWKDNNWNNFKTWYSSNREDKQLPTYFDYCKVRHLETRIIISTVGVVQKFTMKVILDSNEPVSDYYDLSDWVNKNMFVQLVNTYYTLTDAKKFLKQIPFVSE